MNKTEFLNSLNKTLGNIPYEEKRDILYDYEEHFNVGLESGKSEEEIADSLGNPKSIAKYYVANYKVDQAKNDKSASSMLGAIAAVIGLGFFNLVFILGPFIAIVGVLFSLFAAAFAITVSGFVGAIGFFAVLPSYVSLPWNSYMNVGGIFASIGLLCLGLLFFIGDCYLAKLLYKGTLAYLKWNLSIIKR